MKVQSAAFVLTLAIVGLGWLGCAEAPLETQTSLVTAEVHPTGSLSDLDVVQSVIGSGHLVNPEGLSRSVTFNILKYTDGTIEGWYHVRTRGGVGGHVRVQVDCLHVVGNEAWGAGIIVAAINPANIGRPYSMHFIDNGEGADALPDEVGGTWATYYDCVTEPDIPTSPRFTGNLHVRS